MPLTSLLKYLRLKMASLQSPRTQCCCCAVGVFAAMFGFFMLSAGICILLNVTFMEVDTSGLPPELHNDDGKRVVGIILICMAIACLGLSFSVVLVYFVLCNRKPETNNIRRIHQPQNHQNAQPNMYDASTNSLMLANGRQKLRPISKDPAKNNQGSMHSLNGLRCPTPDGAIATNGASSGMGPKVSNGIPSTSGYRGHQVSGHHHRRHHKKQRHRPSKHRSQLPTHTEEDPESARSVPDLKSDRDGPVTVISRSAFYVERSDDDNNTSGTATPERRTTPPKIVIEDTQVLKSASKCTIDSMDENVSESDLVDGAEADRFGTLNLDLNPDPHYGFPGDTRSEHSENKSELSDNLNDSRLTSDLDLDTTLTSASGLASHAQFLCDYNFDESGSSKQTDVSNGILHYNVEEQRVVLNVQPSDGSHSDFSKPRQMRLDSLGSESLASSSSKGSRQNHKLTNQNQKSQLSDSYHQSVKTNEESEERIRELPKRSHLQSSKTNDEEVKGPEIRSESHSSLNSGFSFDGEDPNQSDMMRLRNQMKDLLTESERL